MASVRSRGGKVTQSIRLDTEAMIWLPATQFYGRNAVFAGTDGVPLKVLSDRRAEGAASPGWSVARHRKGREGKGREGKGREGKGREGKGREGKPIRIVAIALSDEHSFGLEAGRGSKTGERLRAKGNYGFDPKDKPHRALIGSEIVSLVSYTGAPAAVAVRLSRPAPRRWCQPAGLVSPRRMAGHE